MKLNGKLLIAGFIGLLMISLLIFGLQALQGKKQPVSLFYFYSPGCPNCMATEPYLDYLEHKYKLRITNFDITNINNSDVVKQYNITSVPTLIVFNNSSQQRYVGRIEVPKAEYVIAKLEDRPPPESPFNTNYDLDPMQCLSCHAPVSELTGRSTGNRTLLPPPSTYSCTTCCHP